MRCKAASGLVGLLLFLSGARVKFVGYLNG
jgi:hypothetical protein